MKKFPPRVFLSKSGFSSLAQGFSIQACSRICPFVEEEYMSVEEAESLIKDFEVLALEWKTNYEKMERKLKIQIEHLQQTIEEIGKENDVD